MMTQLVFEATWSLTTGCVFAENLATEIGTQVPEALK
jgi:hypothetical protein